MQYLQLHLKTLKLFKTTKKPKTTNNLTASLEKWSITVVRPDFITIQNIIRLHDVIRKIYIK